MFGRTLILGVLLVVAPVLPAHAAKLASLSFTGTCVSVGHPIPLVTPVKAGTEVIARPCTWASPVLNWDLKPFGERLYMRSRAQANGRDLCVTFPGDTPSDRVILLASPCDQTLAQLWTRKLVKGGEFLSYVSALGGGDGYCLTVSNAFPGAPRMILRRCDPKDEDQIFSLKQ